MDSLLLFSLMVGDYEHDEIIEMAYYSVLNGIETFCSDSDVIKWNWMKTPAICHPYYRHMAR